MRPFLREEVDAHDSVFQARILVPAETKGQLCTPLTADGVLDECRPGLRRRGDEAPSREVLRPMVPATVVNSGD